APFRSVEDSSSASVSSTPWNIADRGPTVGEAIARPPALSGEHADVDRASSRAVELAEEDPLPRAERQFAAVGQRDEHLPAHERRADVRRRVLLTLLDVLPPPPLRRD